MADANKQGDSATAEIRAVVFDLDGVVWLGDRRIPNVAEAISQLRTQGTAIRFFTNNASKHRLQYVEKLSAHGIAAELHEIITSGYAAARYLTQTYGASRVHVMGTQGLRQEMLEAGHEVVERKSQAVVVGYDREFNWEKLDVAFQNIFEDKAAFIACNQDRRFVDAASFRPGTGATVAALSYSLEREPDVIIGKPNQAIIDALFESLPHRADECLLVGDKLYTDILAGRRAGCTTVLVRSGHGVEEEAKIADIEPHYILDSAADIPQFLKSTRYASKPVAR